MSNHSLCTNYAPWINGAQGAMFWNLSQAKEIAYSIAKQVSHEAYLASKYLLQEPPDIQTSPETDISVTSTGGDDSVQFIVREDPDFVPDANYKNQVMVMFCNNADQAVTVSIRFPDQVLPAGQIDPNYGPDSIQLINGKIFQIDMTAYTARAWQFKIRQ